MVSHADVLVAYKEYPHWDIKDRADELVEVCAKAVRGEVHITGSLVDTGMIIPIHTSREPGKRMVADLKKLEQSPKILTASVIHGFATGDVADMGTRVLVYTDNDVRLASTSASSFAEKLRDARRDFSIEYLSVNEALEASRAVGATPVVLADRADNPGSGAAGDSTFVLAQLIENGFDRTALGPLWDPAAVQICFAAGIGATISLRIGGKTGPMSGNPVDVQCVVKNLKRDHKQTNLTGEPLAVGDTALIDIRGIECLLTSTRAQALDTALFTGVGCELDDKDLVVVKSAHHFYKSFSTVSERVLYVGAPGSATPNWSDLTYEKASLPKWPITAELGPMVSMWP
jgi:microcystin degradation protein MlrC